MTGPGICCSANRVEPLVAISFLTDQIYISFFRLWLFRYREPLIVDPQNHITSQDRGLIHAQFNAIRGPELKNGPSMYIVSPADYDGVEEMAGSKVV